MLQLRMPARTRSTDHNLEDFTPSVPFQRSRPDQSQRSWRPTLTGRLTQAQMAKILQVTQPRVSHLLRGRVDLFGTDTLLDMLGRLGVQVLFVPRPPTKAAGRITPGFSRRPHATAPMATCAPTKARRLGSSLDLVDTSFSTRLRIHSQRASDSTVRSANGSGCSSARNAPDDVAVLRPYQSYVEFPGFSGHR
jgi:transcriptional regulator with XRE-family HTH domain